MPTLKKVIAESQSLNETNDCSVQAIALATDTPYKVVHDLFGQVGRRRCRGTWRFQQLAVLEKLGFEYKSEIHRFKARTITTLERELPSRGIFIVYTRGHMLCCRGGMVLDWTQGRRHRILEVHRVVKKK